MRRQTKGEGCSPISSPSLSYPPQTASPSNCHSLSIFPSIVPHYSLEHPSRIPSLSLGFTVLSLKQQHFTKFHSPTLHLTQEEPLSASLDKDSLLLQHNHRKKKKEAHQSKAFSPFPSFRHFIFHFSISAIAKLLPELSITFKQPWTEWVLEIPMAIDAHIWTGSKWSSKLHQYTSSESNLKSFMWGYPNSRLFKFVCCRFPSVCFKTKTKIQPQTTNWHYELLTIHHIHWSNSLNPNYQLPSSKWESSKLAILTERAWDSP